MIAWIGPEIAGISLQNLGQNREHAQVENKVSTLNKILCQLATTLLGKAPSLL